MGIFFDYLSEIDSIKTKNKKNCHKTISGELDIVHVLLTQSFFYTYKRTGSTYVYNPVLKIVQTK